MSIGTIIVVCIVAPVLFVVFTFLLVESGHLSRLSHWHAAKAAKNLSKVRREVIKEKKRAEKKERLHREKHIADTYRDIKRDGCATCDFKEIALWFQAQGYEVRQDRYHYVIQLPPVTEKELSDIMMK